MEAAQGFYVEISTDGGANFVDAEQVLPGVETLTVAVAEGTSPQFRVRSIRNGVYSAYSDVATADTVPAAPTATAVASTSDSSLTVSWQDNSSNETGFRIERSTDNLNFTQVGTADADDQSFVDSGLSEGTQYFYRVRATMGASRNSTYSASASNLTRPATPTNFTATRNGATIEVAWTDASINADGFILERSTDGVNFAALTTTSQTSYTDTDVSLGLTYTYRLSAVNAGGESTPTAPQAATLLPAVPDDITATVLAGGDSVEVTWSTVAAATGYRIIRTSDGVNWSTLADVDDETSSYTDLTAAENTEYGYRVIAMNAAGLSDESATATANTTLVPPSGVAATAGISSVTLNWTDESVSESAYVIERKEDGGSWTEIDEIAVNSQTYTDNTVAQGTTYRYRVTAKVGAVQSSPSPELGVEVTTDLAAPTALAVSDTTHTTVSLSWTNNATTDTGVRIYRSTDGTNFMQVELVDASESTWTDTARSPETTYYYKVEAVNAAAVSAMSSPATALTRAPAPTTVTAVAATDTAVTVAWTSSSTTRTGFKVERSADAGANWSTIATPGDEETSFADTGLSEGTAYVYRVSVTNAAGDGPTTSAAVTTKLATPTGLAANATGSTSVNLTWTNASSNASGVRVERRIPAGVWSTVANVGVVTTYTDTTVAEGTDYQYRLVATSDSGLPASLPGSAVSITTPANTVTSLTAEAASATSITLAWSDQSARESGYRVERRAGGSNDAFVAVTSLSANAVGYTDTGLTEGTSYEYRIVSLNGAVELASPTTATRQTLPAAPSTLAASSAVAGTISLSWTDNSANETGFVIERSSDGTNFTTLTTTAAGTTSYDDSVAAGASYSYRVRAVQGSTSVASNTVIGLSRPAAPALTVSVIRHDAAQIDWQTVDGVDMYVLEESIDGVNYSLAQLYGSTTDPSVSLDQTGLAESTTYHYRIKAINDAGESDYSSVQSTTTLPTAASDLAATAINPTRIDLSWTANSASATSYRVVRSTGGGAFTTVVDNLAGNATSYSDTSVVGGTTYAYKVYANDGNSDSLASDDASATTVPSAVTSLNAVSSTPTSVDITWNASTGASSYLVERSPDGNNFTTVDTVETNSLTDTTVAEGTDYTYRVTPTGSAGDGPAATTTTTTLPAAATTVAVDSYTATSVTISWQDNSNGEEGFLVERSVDGENWDTLTTTLVDVETYTDNTASEGTEYIYRVRPVNDGGTGDGGTAVVTTRPVAATNAIATGLTATSVQITWDDNSNVETGYDVYRNDGGGWTQVGITQTAGTTLYIDDTAAAGTAYTYKVVAVGNGGDSADSNSANVTTVPAAVEDLEATVASTTQVDLSWSDVAGNTSYRIDRKIGSGAFAELVAGLGANAVSYSDTTAVEGTAYSYRIVAVNAGGDSEASNVVEVTTPPAAPSNFAATPASATSIDLDWTDNSDGETAVLVQQDVSGTWTTIGTLDADATSTTITVDPGTTATYRVIAENAGGQSSPSASATATTVPAQVGNVDATVDSDTTVTVTWDAVSGATGYRVFVSDDGGNNFIQAGSDLAANVLTYSVTALSPASPYQFKVVAFNTTGAGDDSAAVSRTTLPAAPADFAVASISAAGVQVTWTDVSGETGYTVYRKVGSDPFVAIATDLPAGTTIYEDATVDPATTYTYKVVATNGTGASADSDTADALTLTAAPTAPVVTAVTNGSIDLEWSPVTGATDGYKLYRNDGGGWNMLPVVLGSNDLSYSDTDVTESSDYSYYLVAVNATGDSPIGATTQTNTAPDAPTGVSSTSVTTAGLTVTWTDNAAAEDGFVIERSDNGVDWTQVGTADAVNGEGGAGSFEQTDLNEATDYVYRVRATYNNAPSANSGTYTATTAPAAPSDLAVTDFTSDSITLNWTDNSFGETGYVVERSSDGGNNYAEVTTLSAGVTTYTDTGRTENTTYFYRVKAVRNAVSSDYATPVSRLTLVNAPTGVSATVTSPTSVDITWTDASSAEDGYVITRSVDGAGFEDVGTAPANATSYTDAAAIESAEVVYRIRATAGVNSSMWEVSSPVVTPLSAPTSLVAAASPTSMSLSWTPTSGVETGYRVERSPDGTNWAVLTTLAADSGTYVDTGLTEDTTYHYRVIAIEGEEAESDPSNTATAKTPLPAPTGVTVAATTATTATLQWTNVSTAATAIVVQQFDSVENEWDTLATLATQDTSYVVTALTEATDYQFRVLATKTGNASQEVDASGTTRPAAASGFTAAAFSTTQVDLDWTDNSSGETGYRIERSVNGGDFAVLATLAAGTSDYSDTSATEGTTYDYLVYAFGDGGDSVAATGSAVTAPTDPVSFTATPISPTQVDLAWTDASAGETAITVERSSDNGANWSAIATLDPNTTSFSDTTTTEAVDYQYRIRASRDSANGEWVTDSATTPVNAPTGLAATVPTGSPRVVLSWTDASSAESGYLVERSTDGSNWSAVVTTAANATSYSDSTVTEGTTYQYRVRANGAAGNSTFAGPVTASTRPSAPSGLSATALSGTSIQLTWTDVSANESNYRIERLISGTWTTVATIAANSTTFTETGLTEGLTYQYRVRALTEAATGDATASVSAATPLSAPSSLVASAVSTSQVNLTWTDNSSAESSFRIERAINGGGFTQIATLVANTTTYSDTGVTAGTTYTYRVRAVKGAVNSDYSTASPVTTAPTAPSNAAATANAHNSVSFTWTDATGESAYTVERSEDNGANWTVLSSAVAADATTYTDTTTVEETTYTYRVRATNAAGNSAYATATAITTLPAAPTDLAVEALATDTAQLTWTNVSAAASTVKIERRVDGGDWTQIATVAGDVSSYVDPTLDESVSYDYRVRASTGGRNSVYSSTVAVSTLPFAPTDLAISTQTATTVTLTWSTASEAPSTVIERSDDGGDTFDAVGQVAGNVLTFQDTGLTEGTSYQYRVRGYNGAGGFSDPSDTVVADTLPAAPTNLAFTTPSPGNVLLTWADQSGGEFGYLIERRVSGENTWTLVWDLESGSTQYEDAGLLEETYEYRVSAYNLSGSSPSSILVVPLVS